MTIAQYILKMDARTNTLFRIKADGNGVFIENQKEYTREQFYRRYDVPITFTMKQNNADTSKKWLTAD